MGGKSSLIDDKTKQEKEKKRKKKNVNFCDKYYCDNILGVYKYGRDNSVILKAAIEDYDKLTEEEQNKVILEKFSYVKREVPYSDEELIEAIRNEDLKLVQYEYLRKMPGYSDYTIELMVKYDVIKMINKADWTMEDVTEIFTTREDDILKRIMLYTGETKTDDKDSDKRSKKILKRLYDKNSDECTVKFINEFLASDKKNYDCRVFFNEKPIVIYQSEIETIKKISKKYRTNDKDGRRIVRLVCLLLAWQKAFQNQYYNHRFNGYAVLEMDNLLAYNPIVENENGRSDSVALVRDRMKLVEDGYIELLLPEVPAPREIDPKLYYRLSFFVDESNSDNEEVALTITNFEKLWEQIFVVAFKEFDILEKPKEKDIKQGEIREYSKKSKTGKVYVPDKDKLYSFSGSGTYKAGDTVSVYIDGKKKTIKVFKNHKDGSMKSERVYVTYKAVKRCSSCGKMFYAKQMGDGTGNCDVCNRR